MAEEQVHPAVPVVVEEGSGDGVTGAEADPGLVGHIDEPPGLVEAVFEQVVGVAHDGTHEQVEIAVPVDVTERRTAAPMDEIQAQFGSDFLEGAVTPVAVEVVRHGVAADHVEVHVAIAIDVGGCETAAKQFGIDL